MTNNKKKRKKVDDDAVSTIRNFLFKYIPYWPVFIFCILFALFAGWFYAKTRVPQYLTTASLMLKDEKKGTADGQTVNALNQLSEKKIIENEIEVILSRTLMTQVVNRLHLYASYFEADKFTPKSAYSSTPVKIVVSDPQTIKDTKKIEFTFNEKDSIVSIGFQKYPLDSFVTTQYGRLKFIANKSKTRTSESQLSFSLSQPKSIVSSILQNLSASPSTKLTTVLALSLASPDQKEGEDILNELIIVYDKATIDEKNRLASNTLKFIDERLKIVEDELKQIESDEQSYKSNTGSVDIGTQGQLFLKNVSDIDQQMSEINLQLSVLNEVEKSVKTNLSKEGIVPSTLGLKDTRLPEMLTKLYDLELTYEKQKNSYGENHPSLLAVNDQIVKIKSGLNENIKSQRASLEASKLNLASTNNSYSTILQSIPKKERDLINISRQQSTKSAQYAFLLQKKEESELSHRINIGDTRVIDEAEAEIYPFNPNKKKIYAISFLAGLLLPIGIISLKELFNRKILFRQEIENLLDFPIVGEISFNKSKNPIVVEKGKRTFIAEQFRRVRASLGYLGDSSGKKKILVTSSISGEGKSFVSLNLAVSLALTGKKVVLVELDLVNPSLSSKLNVSYDQGASDYLSGKQEPVQVIKHLPSLNENLFYIPAGNLPENPSELLMTNKLKELLAYLESSYDVIIIDSAPASLLSDAYVISPLCDLTLYVIKHKFTPKSYLERLQEEIETGNTLNDMKIIFNGILSRGFIKNGYGYGYGYGYIHDDSKKIKKK